MLVQQVERLRQDLDYSEKVFDRRRVILAKRLREMYKGGPQYAWQELLQANDFGDLLQRYKFLSTIAERDANLVEEVRQRKTDIARREANLTESLAQATSARREKERELARLKANEQKRKNIARRAQDEQERTSEEDRTARARGAGAPRHHRGVREGTDRRGARRPGKRAPGRTSPRSRGACSPPSRGSACAASASRSIPSSGR